MVADTALEPSPVAAISWELLSCQVIVGQSLDPTLTAVHSKLNTSPAVLIPEDVIATVMSTTGVGLGTEKQTGIRV